MKRLLSIIVLVGLLSRTEAQNLVFYGLMPAINQTGRISNKFNYNIFMSTTIDAFDQKIAGIEYPATDLQFYLQPSLIYLHSKKVNFATSYTYQRNNPFNDNFINEHRLWQQVIVSLPIFRSKLTNRVRFEQRFIENKKNGSFPLSTRLRFQLGWNLPLSGRTLEKNEFYLNTYNEVYFSLTGAKNATYSENWTYAGIGYDFGKAGRMELGYLLQIAVRNKVKELRFLNLAQITWITNFNFK